MKGYTTRILKTVALIYIAFPLTYIFAVALLFDIPLNICLGDILLSPFYYFVSVFAVAAGYGLWEMLRWSWYLFLVANVLIGYESAVLVNLYGETHHKVFSFLAAIGFLVIVTYRVAQEVRVPYFFPKIRWWESDPRYRLSVPVRISRPGGELIEGQIMDISTHGCFVRLRIEVPKDEIVALEFSVFGYDVKCSGAIVWCTQSTVTHPRGIGIKFRGVERREKRYLRFITRRLKKIAKLYRRSRYLLNQEAYLKRLEEIEATGRGFRGTAKEKILKT
ncbi:MAG TPA: hypothetical protein DCS07_01890 [Bdellovibrionales bacterium]|nr:MAG: hypothetical protein A2Z97_07960 [Bdellovibrionales bacterium GWB1_52_6]OFZ05127.1 MAG: hypothetical protein A2X97_09240 [Bdellovibrionales bacterium GWA1_52_35]OFZ34916.1 MAG: hypothetical protein A2070_02580 [Bdellovibrionales bacterium GWC1_52_8]HAR41376.1 hypothetical protein [Bdellovibrionales bacterium]HCM38877.1 hypothetical protein [Bdellovibrionales bacterium]